MSRRRVYFAALAFVLCAPLLAHAQTARNVGAELDGVQLSLNIVWTVLAAMLVFFMQAGFAMVEAGFTRAKNACNVLMKNVMDFCIGSIAYFFVGFGLMFGASAAGGWFGTSLFALAFPSDMDADWGMSFWFFQAVFAATACTIVSGAMAERTRFVGYLIYSFAISLVVYPLFGKWAWGSLLLGESGRGWLEARGFVDFAGSTVVHSVGGWAALVGAFVLGPRLGKFAGGRPRAIPGHSIPLAALGTLILWFGWYGFNAGSTTSGSSRAIGLICVNTTLAASAGAVFAMASSWFRFGRPDTGMTLNGALAGLVGVTAGCANLSPATALITGAVAGVLVFASVLLLDQVLRIDDPVGAISVHGVCGAWGTLAVGLFDAEVALATQALGVAVAFLWVVPTSFVIFGSLKALGLLRASEEEEMIGLDIAEHGNEAWAVRGWGDAGSSLRAPTAPTAPTPAGASVGNAELEAG
jgi:Amt family ammonium transporter